ncbi:40S ribosomal protein s7 [Phtheirospermum japonicum]|uniref:40S ribosomal protein S7 n=1 Tax=Phtheirospermum japonicum TaxID=374723 RepID=A0A830AYE1_9LAMI|nr:40S ribosomal protein s7 [Phtheirospermum japonicum]
MALLLRGPKYAHSLLCMMLCSRILFILLRLWGKHTRYRLDGSKIMKVFLDSKAKNDTENKLETFAGVYKKLSGKYVAFEFPNTEA